MFRSPLNIQRSKLPKIVNANARFGNTCKSMVFLTIAKNTPPTWIIQEGKERKLKGIGVKLTLLTNFFSYGNCLITSIDVHHILKKHLLWLIILFVKVCEPKICGDYKIRWPTPFLSILLWMIYINHYYFLLPNWTFLWANNFKCAKSIWVFMEVIPLILLHLINLLPKKKLCARTLPIIFFNL